MVISIIFDQLVIDSLDHARKITGECKGNNSNLLDWLNVSLLVLVSTPTLEVCVRCDCTCVVIAGTHANRVSGHWVGCVALSVKVFTPADKTAADAFDHARLIRPTRHKVWLLYRHVGKGYTLVW